jgi:agmatinase
MPSDNNPPRYGPLSGLDFPRFEGISTFMRLPAVRDLDGVDVAIVGIPFDTGATYRAGARFGPQAVRAGSRLLRPYNPAQKINVFDHLSVIDYGDAPVVPGFIQPSYVRIESALRPLHEAGVVPIGVGGDHSIALAELRAAHATHGPLGLAHFDAHGDTWDQYWGERYTHGTPFRRAVEEGLLDPARCIQVGMRGPLYSPDDLEESRSLGLELIPGDEMMTLGMPAVADLVRQRVGDGPTFLSFDVDFIDPSCTPGTGTPEVGGPLTREALALVRRLDGVQIIGCDVVEVLPAYDVAELTAMTAANVIFEILSLLARQRARLPEDARHAVRPTQEPVGPL